MQGLDALFTILSIVVIYLLPTIIIATKVHPEKTLVVALNFLLGWTIIFWFIALYMSLSREGIERKEARQALTVDALKGQHLDELKELRRKHRVQLERARSRPVPQDDGLAQRQAELDCLKSEYEERLKALSERQSRPEHGARPSTAEDPRLEPEPTPAPQAQPVRTEYQGEALYVVVPSQFERVVAETLSRHFTDQEVVAAGDAGSRGIDLKLFESGGSQSQPSAIVQCKLQAHDQAVDYGDVSDLRGAMSLAGARQAYLVTTGDFSDDARRMIDSGHLEDQVFLVNGMTFNQWRTQAGLAPVHYLSLAG